MYSIIPVLHPYKNRNGLQLITLQIIVDRTKINIKTTCKVFAKQFKNGKVIHHELAEKYNYQLNKQRLEIENKLLNAFRNNATLNKVQLDEIIKGKVITGERFTDFAYTLIDEARQHKKLSEGRIKKYTTVINKINEYNDKTRLTEIDGNWLTKFELHLRKPYKGQMSGNSTIVSNIKVVQAVVREAQRKKIITAYDFSAYTKIKLHFKEPEYLTENELTQFAEICKLVTDPIIKIPGYYFLLSCYTGLRIGDALSFDYKMVKNDEIVLYAEKNKKRSGIPLFTDLENVIEFIKDNKCSYHQKTVRESVKKIALMAGTNKYVKYHASRHTFCTRMLQLGFTIPEVADMAGDTIETISRTYAHVDKKHLKQKVKELMG